MVNQPKLLNQKDLDEIEAMAGLGIRFKDIAKMKGMSDETLIKYAKEELYRGKAKGSAAVCQTAYKMATSGKSPGMTMFWLKTQSGWSTPEDWAGNDKNSNLSESLKHSKHPAEIILFFLADILEQLQQGKLDPRMASSSIQVVKTFMQTVEKDATRRDQHTHEAVENKPIYRSFFCESVPDDFQDRENPDQ